MQTTGAEHITTTTLTAVEWAMILGLGGLFTLMLGFFLSRLIKTLDRLDDAVADLRTTLAAEYVTKQDLRDALRDLKEALMTRRREDCRHEDCPMRED